MVEIKKFLDKKYIKLTNSFFDDIYVLNLDKNNQLFIIFYPNLNDMEKFIHDFCVFFDNKDLNFYCYEMLIITQNDVPYFRGVVEERGIKFFSIMKINELEKKICCGKPYFIQGRKMIKIINNIIELTKYSIKFVRNKNIK